MFSNTKKEDRKAKEALERLRSEAENTDVPLLEQLVPESYQWLEDLKLPGQVVANAIGAPDELTYSDVDTQLATGVDAPDSLMLDIESDPRLKANQLAALDSLQSVVDSGGMTAADTAALSRIQSDVNAEDKGRREAILQQMRQRGQGGSGLELLAQLQSSQAATDRQAQQSLDVAGMAQARALEAMMQQGSLSGQIRGQDFGEQSTVASAQDAINKFNTQNSNQMAQFNTSAQNSMNQFNAGNRLSADQFNIGQAQDTARFNAGQRTSAQQFNANAANQAATQNWAGKQDLASKNTAARNDAQQFNKFTIPNQNFQNSSVKNQAIQNANAAEADYWNKAADRKAAKDAEQTGALIGAGSALGAAAIMASDERVKKDIGKVSSKDIEEFFSAFDPKTYRYKSKEHGEGDKVGFMLQDVEDTKLGKRIIREDEDGTKMYDSQSLEGVMLAAISELMKGKK